jgi:hypothetical protein
VPATPLVAAVNAPRSRTPDEYDSDESMDDDAGSAAGSYDGSGVPGRSSGRSAAYRCACCALEVLFLCAWRGEALLNLVLVHDSCLVRHVRNTLHQLFVCCKSAEGMSVTLLCVG